MKFFLLLILVYLVNISSDEKQELFHKAFIEKNQQSLINILINCKDISMRRESALMLGELKSKFAVPYLVKTIKHESPELRNACLDALEKIKAKNSIIPLIEYLKTNDSNFQQKIVKTLAKILSYNTREISKLRMWIKNSDIDLRIGIIKIIGNLGSDAREYIPYLIEGINSSYIKIRVQSIISLGRMGKHAQSAVTNLSELLKDKSTVIKDKSALALSLIQLNKKLIPYLLKILENNRERQEQVYIIRCLKKLQMITPKILSLLEKLLENPDDILVIESAEFLISNDTCLKRSASDKLLHFLRDPNHKMWDRCLEILMASRIYNQKLISILATTLNLITKKIQNAKYYNQIEFVARMIRKFKIKSSKIVNAFKRALKIRGPFPLIDVAYTLWVTSSDPIALRYLVNVLKSNYHFGTTIAHSKACYCLLKIGKEAKEFLIAHPQKKRIKSCIERDLNSSYAGSRKSFILILEWLK